jgi:hypothetical protein
MEYYDYILKRYNELGNLSTETKEEIISRMMASEFAIPQEIALMAIKYTLITTRESFQKALDSLGKDIVTLVT